MKLAIESLSALHKLPLILAMSKRLSSAMDDSESDLLLLLLLENESGELPPEALRPWLSCSI